MKDELLARISILEQENTELRQENEQLNTIIANIHNYIDRMSYCAIVDNPRKELSRILEKGE
jgi:cell division protein FtsB